MREGLEVGSYSDEYNDEEREPVSSMLDYKLYEVAPVISNIIRNNVNPETGEIAETAVEQIVELEEHAEVKIHNCGQILRRAQSNVAVIDEQRRKLLDDKNRILKESARLEEYLIRCAEMLHIDKVVMDGKTTEIKMSRESVVGDVEKCDPEYIVVSESRRIDKRGVMKIWRNEGRKVEGTDIVKRKIVKV